MSAFTIGLDFGTNSVRAVVVSCTDGATVGTHVFDYPSGEDGILLDPRDHHLARQHPGDYLLGLKESVLGALGDADGKAGFAREAIIGVGVDTTGSTPLPVDAKAQPLGLDPAWEGNLAAHAWLWKDHTGAEEAAAITAMAAKHAPEYVAVIGGTYSSEWFWSKIWRCLEVAPEVFEAAASWVELADYIPAVLTGVEDPEEIQRSVCAAGHKAMYSRSWGGLPSKDFLVLLDPRLAELRDRLYREAFPPDRPAGTLTSQWAETLGLPERIPVAMGGFDAHYGAVGAGVQKGTLVKIIGTSTCDIAVAPDEEVVEDVPGICGIVDGSVMPQYYGIEAGQSAVGDILRWWVEEVCEGDEDLHDTLSAEAARLQPGETGLLALDWNNGNRTILVDPRLTGLLLGQTLHTNRAEVYRTLIEATAFGARAIVERLTEFGIPVDRVVNCGGIAEKNDLFMQIYADVLGRPMLIAGSPQTPALGSAISAAVAAGGAAGGYDTFEEAQGAMTFLKEKRFEPDPEANAVYDELYGMYLELHDAFGGVSGATSDFPSIMKRLLALRSRVVSNAANAAAGNAANAAAGNAANAAAGNAANAAAGNAANAAAGNAANAAAGGKN
jgi:L-ribulokinase